MKSRERPVMVVHGPEIFDTGYVYRLNNAIRPERIIVAGVMARTAAEESGIPVEYSGIPPSGAIRNIEGSIFLANCGKTPESGRIFGEIIAGRLGSGGLIQVECSDNVIYRWNEGDIGLAELLSDRTGYRIENAISEPAGLDHELRSIRGCIPGEPVFVNGIVIGCATECTVVLSTRDGHIEPVWGIRIKAHGIEKLERTGPVNPGGAWCKSGMVRRSHPAPGIIRGGRSGYGRVITIDHCGCDIYRYLRDDVCGVLAIGDDTTAICGHICAHLGIPVLGITDGDEDTIICGQYAPGSIVILVTCGSDDDIGREISSSVAPVPVVWDSWVTSQVNTVGNRGRIVKQVRADPRE